MPCPPPGDLPHSGYDPEIPLLGIYPKNTNWKDTFTPMFIAAVFTTVKVWKQPKCLSSGKWIKKIWDTHTHTDVHTHTHNGILLSAIKKDNILHLQQCVNGLGGHYANWNKSERERQILYDITYMWNLEIKQTSE